MAATTICLINQKGGCGKSSTCFHLAGHFARRDQQVLLIDADPQGSLSQGFFGSEYVESFDRSETLAALFDENIFVPAASLVIPTPIAGISIVPANQTLAVFNRPAPETAGMEQFALRAFLDELHDFDIVLVDCPPNLYQCSWNAMIGADFVLIPVPPEDFGTQGLRVVHQAIEHARRLNQPLALLGHVVTRCDSRLLVHRSYEQKLRTLYGETVLETTIPEAAAYKVALACREPVTHYSVASRASLVMQQLGDELCRRMGPSHAKQRVA